MLSTNDLKNGNIPKLFRVKHSITDQIRQGINSPVFENLRENKETGGMIFFLSHVPGWAVRYSSCNMVKCLLSAGQCAGHINETRPLPWHSSVFKKDRQLNKHKETLVLIKNTWQEPGTSSPRDPAKEGKMQTNGWCQVGTRLMGGIFASYINV